jgi:Co/Zn/Cd efflux system component
MSDAADPRLRMAHEHVFLGAHHDEYERRTWGVIALCSIMMVAEIVGGSLFGSLALVADGLHMSTHASAMLIAALATAHRQSALKVALTFSVAGSKTASSGRPRPSIAIATG